MDSQDRVGLATVLAGGALASADNANILGGDIANIIGPFFIVIGVIIVALNDSE